MALNTHCREADASVPFGLWPLDRGEGSHAESATQCHHARHGAKASEPVPQGYLLPQSLAI